MRAFGIALGLIVFGTFLFASAPTAWAAAYCVDGVVNTYPHDDCDGAACLGYTQNGWQYCAPDTCAYQTDCCYYLPQDSFYCP